jgi:glucose/arabinose dehydrogenase
MNRYFSRVRLRVAFILIAIGFAARVAAATLPAGFREVTVASGLAAPTAMQFAPDGRLFICEQAGRLRVVKDG